MRIEVKGRNTPVTEDLNDHVIKRFRKIGRQVSELAVLEIEITEERNPSNPESWVAEGTLYLKGCTLRAKEASRDLDHSVNMIADELARQVKRHRDKRRARRVKRAAPGSTPDLGAPAT
jgi:putative sigma-54 modulation protein